MYTSHKLKVIAIIRFITLSIFAVLLSACSTNSDIENLQSQIDGLKTSVTQTSSDAAAAMSALETAQQEIEMLKKRVLAFETLCTASPPKKS
jgi:outer membrane murein-binding lipoprotein Lpp